MGTDEPKLSDAEMAELDQLIYQERILEAHSFLQARLGCGLHESFGFIKARYVRLRAETPDRFKSSNEEYGAGYDS